MISCHGPFIVRVTVQVEGMFSNEAFRCSTSMDGKFLLHRGFATQIESVPNQVIRGHLFQSLFRRGLLTFLVSSALRSKMMPLPCCFAEATQACAVTFWSSLPAERTSSVPRSSFFLCFRTHVERQSLHAPSDSTVLREHMKACGRKSHRYPSVMNRGNLEIHG